MKHIDLQASLAYLRTLYQAYEADGIQISGSTMSVSSYADFAYFKYLLFLANLDHVITEEEITFLNRCLYQSISEPMVKSLLQQYTISFSSVQSTLLSLLAALVQADYRSDSHTDGSVSLLLLETLEQMGKQFAITTAGEVGAQQNLTIQTMIQQLSRYWNASMQERKCVDRSRAATVPEDLAAGKPPVPLSKEPVITDADVTDAPTETLEELMEQLLRINGTAGGKGRAGSADSSAENSRDPSAAWSATAADCHAHGLFRQSGNRENNCGAASRENLCAAGHFEKGSPGRGGSHRAGEWLCGTNGDQDQKGDRSGTWRRALPRRSVNADKRRNESGFWHGSGADNIKGDGG